MNTSKNKLFEWSGVITQYKDSNSEPPDYKSVYEGISSRIM